MEYKHFSHNHNLVFHQVQQGQNIRCSGCELDCSSGFVYACFQCSFYLHEHCGNANRHIMHPADVTHPLILFPSPTYESGSFLCDACGKPGSAFSYCCAVCQVDLHVQCAFMPLKITHKCHRHELKLSTGNPDRAGREICNICTTLLDSKHWSYYCAECDFGVHTFCGTNEVKPALYVDAS